MRSLVLARIGEVLIDVALRIDDGAVCVSFVADEIRGVGEAVEIELFEDHDSCPFVELEACSD